MKKASNFGMAVLVFVITMLLMNGAGILLATGTSVIGLAIGGSNGVNLVYDFMMNHLNLYSCLIYVIFGTVFLLWYYFAFIEPQGTGKFAAAQTQKLSPVCFIWLVPLTFAVQHAASLLMGVITVVAPSAMEKYAELVETSGLNEYSPVWAVATLILPPLVEETIFRGLIMQYLRRAGACFVAANLIQSILFGIFHMNVVQGIYTSVFGFLLGYLAWRYQSLLVPMAMHALFNFFGTAVIDIESRFFPEFLQGVIIMASIPLLIIVLVMIHFGIGEKKKGN